MIIAGVEEAGRGPVIGPMVMAICAIAEEKQDELKSIGVKDSKLLTPKRREELFSQIQRLCNYEIIILEPQKIDSALNDPEMNLNKLEGVTSAELINRIAKIDRVILDCPSTNIKAYREFVATKVKNNAEVIAEHKADVNHVIVGAASIIAKVTRDRLIEQIKEKIHQDFGSGYPSDPKTVEFLKNNWNKYDFFRTTWSTYKKVAEVKVQKELADYE